MARFDEQVTAWVRKSEGRMLAVFRESAQHTINEAQEPRGAGGNMPVDTGFLRNSGMAELNTLPVGESSPPEGYQSAGWNPQDMLLAINRAQIGDRIVFGWVANYAPYMEARYGFLRLAVQNWPQTVRDVSRRAEKRVGK